MTTQDIAIVGYAQSPSWRKAELTEPQLLFPVIADAIAMANIDRRDIGFTCAGSCDYLSGQTFAFVMNLEASSVVHASRHYDRAGLRPESRAGLRVSREPRSHPPFPGVLEDRALPEVRPERPPVRKATDHREGLRGRAQG